MIHCFDKEYNTRGSMVSVIPTANYNDENAFVLDYLSYKPAPDYKNMSYDEIREYITSYYNNVLSELDPEELLRELRGTILVSDERTDSLAIRHIVAEWLNLLTDEPVYESGVEDGHLVLLERPEFIKPMLEEAIKNSKGTKGLQSVRALYLLEKADKLEKVGMSMQAACYRTESNNVERTYNGKQKTIGYRVSRKYIRKR